MKLFKKLLQFHIIFLVNEDNFGNDFSTFILLFTILKKKKTATGALGKESLPYWIDQESTEIKLYSSRL